MTITEYAKQMGISRATLYNKAKAAGVDLSSLRDNDGALTDEALSELSGLLDGTLQRKRQDALLQGDTDPETIAVLQRRIVELTDELTRERTRADGLQAQINSMLQQTADRERQHADELRDILQRQQAIAERQLLPERVSADGRGLFGRIHDALFGVKNSGKDENGQD